MSVRKAGAATLTKFRGDMTYYESVVMADAPAMFWPLQTDKRDISGNNRPVNSLAGTIQWGEEQSLQPNDSSARSWYSGGSGVISRTDEAWMDTSTITVECLLRKTSGTSYAFAVSRDAGSSSNRMWMLRFNNDGTIQVIAWNTGGTLYFVNGSTIVGNMNTVHIAFTWSDAYLSLYLNGEDEGTPSAISGTLRTGNRAIEVFQGAGSFPLTGYISHVAVFTSALTKTQINAHATAAGL